MPGLMESLSLGAVAGDDTQRLAKGFELRDRLALLTGKDIQDIMAAFKRTNLSFEQFYQIALEQFSQGSDPLEWTNE